MPILLNLFLTFAKVGLVGFGGGLAILPLIYQGVTLFTDITPEEFANLVGISQATPGPIAMNAATYVGYLSAGIPGSVAATFGIAVPSFIIVQIVARALERYKESPLVKSAFTGIRPAAMGMIASALVFVTQTSIVDVETLVLALVTFVLAAKTKLGAIPIIIIMGVVGALCTNLPVLAW